MGKRTAAAAWLSVAAGLVLGAAAPAGATEGDAPALIAAPGDCAIARPHFAVLGAPEGASGAPRLLGEPCDLDCVAGNPSDRLTPNDVAAAPKSPSAGTPSKPSSPIQSGCLVGNCGPRLQQSAVGIVEPPAVIGLPPGLPGSGNGQPE